MKTNKPEKEGGKEEGRKGEKEGRKGGRERRDTEYAHVYATTLDPLSWSSKWL